MAKAATTSLRCCQLSASDGSLHGADSTWQLPPQLWTRASVAKLHRKDSSESRRSIIGWMPTQVRHTLQCHSPLSHLSPLAAAAITSLPLERGVLSTRQMGCSLQRVGDVFLGRERRHGAPCREQCEHARKPRSRFAKHAQLFRIQTGFVGTHRQRPTRVASLHAASRRVSLCGHSESAPVARNQQLPGYWLCSPEIRRRSRDRNLQGSKFYPCARAVASVPTTSSSSVGILGPDWDASCVL